MSLVDLCFMVNQLVHVITLLANYRIYFGYLGTYLLYL